MCGKEGIQCNAKMFQKAFEFETALYKKYSGTNHNLCVVKKVHNFEWSIFRVAHLVCTFLPMTLPAYLPICILHSIHLPASNPSIHPSHPSCLSITNSPPIYLSIYLSISSYLSIHPSIHPAGTLAGGTEGSYNAFTRVSVQ